MNKLLWCMSLLFIIAGCAVHKQNKSTDFLQQQEIIAKFADLPDTPFQVKMQKIAVSTEHADQLQLFYTSSMVEQDLIAFYQQQMERLGWDLHAESSIQDCLMHFVKPSQSCFVLISQNHLSIYVCSTKGA